MKITTKKNLMKELGKDIKDAQMFQLEFLLMAIKIGACGPVIPHVTLQGLMSFCHPDTYLICVWLTSRYIFPF